MASGGIKLNLTGFDEMLKKIEKAGGNIDKAVESTMRESATILHTEFKKQMLEAKPALKPSLANRLPPPVLEKEGNRTTAFIGFEKGAYNPDNLSDGYKAIFANYGTPRETARNFIQKTKSKSKNKIKKKQEETLNEILKELQS